MLARTHVIFGMAFLAAGGMAGGLTVTPAAVAVAALGSLLPDVDHPHSVFGRRVRPLSDLIALIFGHRGITHSLLAAMALVGGMAYFRLDQNDLLVALALGYLSHLFGDWLTPSGVPLLWPSRRSYRSPVTIRTGGAGEHILILGIFLVFLYETTTITEGWPVGSQCWTQGEMNGNHD